MIEYYQAAKYQWGFMMDELIISSEHILKAYDYLVKAVNVNACVYNGDDIGETQEHIMKCLHDLYIAMAYASSSARLMEKAEKEAKKERGDNNGEGQV